MLMAENGWSLDDFSVADEFDAGSEELSIDIETLMNILDEKEADPVKSDQEDPPLKTVSQDESIPDTVNGHNLHNRSEFQDDLMDPAACYPSRDMWDPSQYANRLEMADGICIPVQTCSASLNDWSPLVSVTCSPGGVELSQFEAPGCTTITQEVGNWVSDHINEDSGLAEGRDGFQIGGNHIDSKSEDSLHSLITENLDVRYGHSGALTEHWSGLQGSPQIKSTAFLDFPFGDADVPSCNMASTDSTICHSSEVVSDVDDHHSAMRYNTSTEDTVFTDSLQYHFPNSFHFQYLSSNGNDTINRKDEIGQVPTNNACLDSRMTLNVQGSTNSCGLEVPVFDFFDGKGQCEAANHVTPACGIPLSNIDVGLADSKVLLQPFCYSNPHFSGVKHSILKYEGNDEIVASRSTVSSSVEQIDEALSRQSSYSNDGNSFSDGDMDKFFSGITPSVSSQKEVFHVKQEKEHVSQSRRVHHHQRIIDETYGGYLNDGRHWRLGVNMSGQYLASSKKQLDGVMDEMDLELIRSRSMGWQMSKVSPESIQSYSSDKSHVDDDPDICILEDISQPARSNQSLVLKKTFHMNQPAKSSLSLVSGSTVIASHHSSYSDSSNYIRVPVPYSGMGGRPRPHDEHSIFRAALQDLSQPKSEESPPDGVLAVPLLRHQRIALSWMVQKETCSLHCSGGILADDQGLGKTVSTIALILKEKPPTFRTEDVGKCELETLNLDDEDEESNEVDKPERVKPEPDLVMSNGASTKSLNFVNHRGRPAAGTLVVCPTSVLRQWNEELHNKVTSKGRLSVLVYHGSSRTKDPYELAKYDVVITTYSIVSMEVPKQPLVDKEDNDDKMNAECIDVSPMSSASKKRKIPPGSDKKGLKHKKGMDGKLLEIAAAGPLAKVGWFRVVLDEAQSIKNHRTQVARACWGLRAKRRWCLSGTPIQNAIDDLYSYFRFLRYDPYAVYKLFCSKIKFPITKDPAKGYRKLQAVLKTIMLRRTKNTLLDGEPIINLPPKTIDLKKVDFTKEERAFYNQLEIDSRNQFQEYAAAGTVKQNYVNILLMLLRLRQACDHPLLVKGFDSKSLLRSSVEMARKLPREQLMCLLNCLEASLAICGICNDPPEDAVVTVCGHVFCNQCICEHLTGDTNQCPSRNCKFRLSVSTVFSKAALNSSLSEQSGQQSSTDSSGSEIVEAVEPSKDLSYDSSKIKAALEVLQSLAKPWEIVCGDSSSLNLLDGRSFCAEKSTNLCAGDSLINLPDKNHLVVEKSSTHFTNVAGEKAIVFSQWTKMLDLLEASLNKSSIQYRRLDGTMSILSRDKAVKDFNTLPEVSVMIMSLKAASLGLNMVAASHVLLLDLWWNPTTEDQAIDRAHRIGQTRPVTVLRLMVRNTVEDRILALQEKKRQMVASAFGEDEKGGRQTRLTVEDLNYLFKA